MVTTTTELPRKFAEGESTKQLTKADTSIRYLPVEGAVLVSSEASQIIKNGEGRKGLEAAAEKLKNNAILNFVRELNEIPGETHYYGYTFQTAGTDFVLVLNDYFDGTKEKLHEKAELPDDLIYWLPQFANARKKIVNDPKVFSLPLGEVLAVQGRAVTTEDNSFRVFAGVTQNYFLHLFMIRRYREKVALIGPLNISRQNGELQYNTAGSAVLFFADDEEQAKTMLSTFFQVKPDRIMIKGEALISTRESV